MYTLTALRRRGFPSEAINNFCAQLGVTGAQSSVDPSMLEAFARDCLNKIAPRFCEIFDHFLNVSFIYFCRRMVVLEPLKITIENFPAETPIEIEVPNFPNKPDDGSHKVTFNKVIYIEKTDFMEVCFFCHFFFQFVLLKF